MKFEDVSRGCLILCKISKETTIIPGLLHLWSYDIPVFIAFLIRKLCEIIWKLFVVFLTLLLIHYHKCQRSFLILFSAEIDMKLGLKNKSIENDAIFF